MVAAAAATSILSLCGTSPALADSDASGTAKDSPGVLSGNNVQVPVDAPVNACGNSIDAVALLNPAFGNSCANDSGSPRGGSYDEPYGGGDSGPGSGHGSGHGKSDSGSSAHGRTEGSPGVGSGNNTGVPVDVPVNACGNTADVISGLNPVFGNDCDSGGYGDDHTAPPYGGEDTPTPTPPNGGGHPTPTPTPSPPSTPTPTPPNGGDHPWTPTPTPTPPTHGDQPTPPGPHGPPPHLPDTGSSSEALLAASGASAALIAAGSVLYRRGRAASRR
ncbi:chaplin [Streptomyces sp. NBC_00663]|uniref:chaplin n=1 Tax=Streptomyces sp. NBC_00663 TaxID=2975801 RepID=UPI002E372273|nr:chaplin [Streptomyces sp. NBC_00663]